MLPRKLWEGKQKMVRVSDIIIDDGRPDDIGILVIGVTGVRKSPFINTAIGKVVVVLLSAMA